MGLEERTGAPAATPPIRPAQIVLILAIAIVAGAVVRFWELGSRPLWLDEAYSAYFATRGWTDLWRVVPSYEVHPPFYYSILKLWSGVAGDSAAGLRSLSAIAGLGSVGVAAASALALQRLRPVSNPLLLVAGAVGLAALSPRLLYLAQDARPYGLLTLAYAVALCGWLRLTINFRTRGEGKWADWLLLGGGTASALWLHSLGLLHGAALLGALLLVALPGATPARWRRLGVTVGIVALLYLPCVLMLTERVGDWGQGWLSWNPRSFAGDLVQLYALHVLDEKVTPIAAFLLFPVLIYIGLRTMLRDGDRALAGAFALLLLAPPLVAALISQAGLPVFLPRTLVAVLAPAYLLIAYGISRLPRGIGLGAAALVAAILLANLPQMMARSAQERWDEAAALLRRAVRPGDVIWVYPNDVQLPLERALGVQAMTPIPAAYPAVGYPGGTRPNGSPAVVGLDGGEAAAWASANTPPPGATIWLVRGGAWLFDPDDAVLTALSNGRAHTAAQEWDYIDIHALRPVQPP